MLSAAFLIAFVALIVDASVARCSDVLIRRNLRTGEKFVKNLTEITTPSAIRRLRLLVGRSRAVGSRHAVVDVYRVKLRWVEPEFWNDAFNETARSYEVACEVEDEDSGMTQLLLNRDVPWEFTGFDENFVLHREIPLVVRCGIRCKNSAGLESDWTLSSDARLYKLYRRPVLFSRPLLFPTEFAPDKRSL